MRCVWICGLNVRIDHVLNAFSRMFECVGQLHIRENEWVKTPTIHTKGRDEGSYHEEKKGVYVHFSSENDSVFLWFWQFFLWRRSRLGIIGQLVHLGSGVANAS